MKKMIKEWCQNEDVSGWWDEDVSGWWDEDVGWWC